MKQFSTSHASKAIRDAREQREQYYKSVKVHQPATVGVHSGAHGCLTEMEFARLVDAIRGAMVKGAGQTDVIKTINGKRLRFECKSGNFQILASFPINADIPSAHEIYSKVDFFIYCPFYFDSLPFAKQALVIPRFDFCNILDTPNKMRHCRTSAKNGCRAKVNTSSGFRDWFIRNYADNFPTVEEWLND